MTASTQTSPSPPFAFWDWAMGLVGLALLAAAMASFFFPPWLEHMLAVNAGRIQGPGEGAWFLGLMAATGAASWLLASSMARIVARFEGAATGKEWLGTWVAIFMVGLMGVPLLGTKSADYEAVVNATHALDAARASEAQLGRSTPVGDRLRQATVSLAAAKANADVVDMVLDSSNNPQRVMEILAAAPVLGSQHPSIRFVSDNGLVRPQDRARVYRDLVERVREGDTLAKDPAMAALMARLVSR